MHTYIHTCIHTSIHPYMHTYIHEYIHTCMHTYTHTYIHAYIHAYMHTYLHTYIHTYIHTSVHRIGPRQRVTVTTKTRISANRHRAVHRLTRHNMLSEGDTIPQSNGKSDKISTFHRTHAIMDGLTQMMLDTYFKNSCPSRWHSHKVCSLLGAIVRP